jgi:hypothetical protein
MSNPVDPGTFESYLPGGQPFGVAAPKTGSTGDFETVVTAGQPFTVYTEVAAGGGPAPVTIFNTYYAPASFGIGIGVM